MENSFKQQPLRFLYVFIICGFDLTTDTPACLSSPFSCHIVIFFPFIVPLLVIYILFISYSVNEHFTLWCCTVSQSKLTVLLLVIGECGGWDVIGWGPYGKHSWYLLSSLLLGNYWESSSTRGKKMFPFLFSFLLRYQFSFCILYCTLQHL